jgi:hypothetical protein
MAQVAPIPPQNASSALCEVVEDAASQVLDQKILPTPVLDLRLWEIAPSLQSTPTIFRKSLKPWESVSITISLMMLMTSIESAVDVILMEA